MIAKLRRANKRARDRALSFRRRKGKSGWVIRPERFDSMTGIAHNERRGILAEKDFVILAGCSAGLRLGR